MPFLRVWAVSSTIPEEVEPVLPLLFGNEAAATAYLNDVMKQEWESFAYSTAPAPDEEEPYPGDWHVAQERISAAWNGRDGDGWGRWDCSSMFVEVSWRALLASAFRRAP